MERHPTVHWPLGRLHRMNPFANRTRRAAGRRATVVTLFGATLLFAASLAAPPTALGDPPADAEPLAQSPQDGQIARVIAQLMPQNHISGKGLDDEISRRALDLYLETLDPQKLYFFQSDIDEFQRDSSRVDEMVEAGELGLAYRIFERFTQRVDERVAVALELLDGEFDFTRDETIVIDPEVASYATDAEEARDRWRKQIKYALLDLKEGDTEEDDAVDRLRRRYQRYSRRWNQTKSDDLLEMYLTAVTMSFDPHSTYMSPDSLKDFAISMRLNLDGIGAALREKDGTIVVSSVIPGGAASKHGKLKPDDVIVSVGQGEDESMVDVLEMPLKEVVKLIRGKAGTTVRLGVKPGGVGNLETYTIVRARVELEESAARGKVIEHERPDGSAVMKIGYINLPSFYLDMEKAKQKAVDFRSSTRDVRRLLEEFKSEGVDGVVLDLSKNGGGSLTEAISLTGLFIDHGPVVQVKSSDGTIQQHADNSDTTVWDGPLVVMTSKFSASASEIFAGAVKDYGRGIVVGDPATHGKGTVQTLMDLGEQLFRNNRENYGALKVTLQQFYLPDGDSTQLDGVAADVVLPSITAKMDISEGDLKYALEHDRVPAAEHDRYQMVPQPVVERLRENSAKRVEQDEDFVELLRRIELYEDQKERAVVSLDQEEFAKRRAELNARQEEEVEELSTELTDEEVFSDTYYNREVLNIAHEYVDALRRQNLAVVK